MDKVKLLASLMNAFDERMEQEKEDRAIAPNNEAVLDYHNGRVDGVDTGRFIVEKLFSELE